MTGPGHRSWLEALAALVLRYPLGVVAVALGVACLWLASVTTLPSLLGFLARRQPVERFGRPPVSQWGGASGIALENTTKVHCPNFLGPISDDRRSGYALASQRWGGL